MAKSACRCLPDLGIGELRQAALHFAATNATGLDALFEGIILEAESRVKNSDSPASAVWKCQCVSDILWSLHRARVQSSSIKALACSLALESVPDLDVFQLSNLVYR